MKFNEILNVIRYIEAWFCATLIMSIMIIFAMAIGGWWLAIPTVFVALDAATMVMSIMLNFEGVLFLGNMVTSMRNMSYAR